MKSFLSFQTYWFSFKEKKKICSLNITTWENIGLNSKLLRRLVLNLFNFTLTDFQSVAYSDWNDAVATSSNGGCVVVYAARHVAALTYKQPVFEKVILRKFD